MFFNSSLFFQICSPSFLTKATIFNPKLLSELDLVLFCYLSHFVFSTLSIWTSIMTEWTIWQFELSFLTTLTSFFVTLFSHMNTVVQCCLTGNNYNLLLESVINLWNTYKTILNNITATHPIFSPKIHHPIKSPPV